MKDLFAVLVYLTVTIGGSMAWLYAIIRDAQAERYVWLILDLVIPPLGAIRGLILWL